MTLCEFKAGDRVKHVEFIVEGYGTITKVGRNNEFLGQDCKVKWDTLVGETKHYGAYLRKVNHGS